MKNLIPFSQTVKARRFETLVSVSETGSSARWISNHVQFCLLTLCLGFVFFVLFGVLLLVFCLFGQKATLLLRLWATRHSFSLSKQYHQPNMETTELNTNSISDEETWADQEKVKWFSEKLWLERVILQSWNEVYSWIAWHKVKLNKWMSCYYVKLWSQYCMRQMGKMWYCWFSHSHETYQQLMNQHQALTLKFYLQTCCPLLI